MFFALKIDSVHCLCIGDGDTSRGDIGVVTSAAVTDIAGNPLDSEITFNIYDIVSVFVNNRLKISYSNVYSEMLANTC